MLHGFPRLVSVIHTPLVGVCLFLVHWRKITLHSVYSRITSVGVLFSFYFHFMLLPIVDLNFAADIF